MSKSVKTAIVAVVSVLLIAALIAGIWLFANGQTATNTTVSVSNAPANTIKSGDYYIYADDTVKTATGEYVYKVYCDNCSGSGDATVTTRCSAGCEYITPYRLSGFMVECETCSGTGVCQVCDGKGYTVGGWLNTHYGCKGCGGSGEDGWLGDKYVEGDKRCADCKGTGEVYAVCATCKGSHYITTKEDCSVCSGKGYYWMSGVDIIDCSECKGIGSTVTITEMVTCTTGCIFDLVLGNSYIRDTCSSCNGSRKCSSCGGKGYTRGGLTGNTKYGCGSCGGSGGGIHIGAEPYKQGSGKCRTCHGSGLILTLCSTCGGRGMIERSVEQDCKSCNGLGYISTEVSHACS